MNNSRDISNRRPGWIQKPSQQNVPKRKGLAWTTLFLTAAWTTMTTLELMAFLSSRLSPAGNEAHGVHPFFFWLASSGFIAALAVWNFKKKHGALSFEWFRPLNVLTLLLFALMGCFSGTLYFARLNLQNISDQVTGLFEDYNYLRQQIPTPGENPSAHSWFDAEGNLLPTQKSAWCAQTLPLIQQFWQTHQSTGRDTKELAGLLTNGMYSIAHANGCLSAEDLLNHKRAIFKSVSEHPSHNQRLNQSLHWVPFFKQLGEAQSIAEAKLMPTPAGLCLDMVARARQQKGQAEATQGIVAQCEAAFPKDRQATLQDLEYIQETM